MNLGLGGMVALVTGGSHGLGLAIATSLFSEGCRVAVNGRDQSTLAEAAVGISGDALAVAGDVADPASARLVVQKVLEHFGRLDILVANVGGGGSAPPGEEHPDEWQRVFSLNLWSATNMVEASRAALSASGGSIICISSICGSEVVPGAPVTYSSAKAALNAYVRGIARPLALQGIRINAVAPGNLLFEGSVWSRRLDSDPDTVQQMLVRDVAQRRLGDAGEIANLVAFLASRRSAFATGSVWTMDGGQRRGA